MGIPAPSPLGPDCHEGNQTHFVPYQNYGAYYGNPSSDEQIHYSTAEAGLMTGSGSFVAASAHQRAQHARSAAAAAAAAAVNFDQARLSFSFRTDPQSPSNRSSSDQ